MPGSALHKSLDVWIKDHKIKRQTKVVQTHGINRYKKQLCNTRPEKAEGKVINIKYPTIDKSLIRLFTENATRQLCQQYY